ncbi:MarR family transcriptional regulator [Shewanella sp. 3B26]|uniref:MarR family transcriptional regulator n=1 Tax=Shewanella zhuhaiensis TaxID=2919576 RepID=A0AAJ1F0K5_9GAMM|nr:MarR family transcriptional regulator [Shewanella zhuhaiensis]MCH4294453.1 MarR family transcriptional regulator [Shewanella zhuhaiensis]
MSTKEMDINKLLVEFYERFSAWEHHIVEGSGLPLPMMHTLELLGLYGPMRMTDLAEKLCISTGTLTVRVDKLASDGLVERIANPQDRRSLLISLTSQGLEIFKEHDRAHLDMTAKLTSNLSADDKATLQRLLGQLTEQFDTLA